MSSNLPTDLIEALRAFIHVVRAPLAVRSSSKLEDSYYQPFAGIYSTYMIPAVENEDQQLRLLSKAIKSVYASVYFASSKGYITATANVISEEKMAIILQEICGAEDDGYFFPTLSGVARSVNYYPIGYEKAEEGIAKVAFGLGKAVVDGEQVLVECALPDFRVEPSQGTHFFQNLTSFNAGYVNVDSYSREGDIADFSALDALPAAYETTFLRHVRLQKPLTVCVDGRTGQALVKL